MAGNLWMGLRNPNLAREKAQNDTLTRNQAQPIWSRAESRVFPIEPLRLLAWCNCGFNTKFSSMEYGLFTTVYLDNHCNEYSYEEGHADLPLLSYRPHQANCQGRMFVSLEQASPLHLHFHQQVNSPCMSLF